VNSHEIDFAQHVPFIESGLANIKLGIFAALSESYKHSFGPALNVPLAYCVLRHIFCDPISQSTLEEFARHNSQLIESELRKVMSNPELKNVISLAYAALIIELGWQTHNPANNDANKTILLLDRATDNDLLIPNIVEMWGSKAILNFFQCATDFAVRNLPQTT